MLRYALAPVNRDLAAALGVARTLPGASGVAITFDDGPHPEGTPAVLELLAAASATATFFLIGEQVRARPQLVARIAGAGHAIALHGDLHHCQLRLSERQVRADLQRGRATVEDAAGRPVMLHRPPYGVYSPSGLRAARQMGMTPLLWSRWGKDWRKFTTPERIARRATRALVGGDVILLHDADFYSSVNSHQRTIRALSMVISELDRRKLDTVLPV